jgi:hypothetical protein
MDIGPIVFSLGQFPTEHDVSLLVVERLLSKLTSESAAIYAAEVTPWLPEVRSTS